MSVASRWNRLGRIKSFGTPTKDDAGGLKRTEADLVTELRFHIYQATARTRQLHADRMGLQPDGVDVYGTCAYDALIAKDQLLVDDTTAERWRIVGAHPQRRNQQVGANHIALALAVDVRTTAEA